MVQQADFESRAASVGKDPRNVSTFPYHGSPRDWSLSRRSAKRRSRI
jgi:hypothetical protein